MTEKILKEIAEDGYKIEDLKEIIINALDEFFDNKQCLEKYVFQSEIIRAFEFVVRYNKDSEFKIELLEVLNCYKTAYQKDKDTFWNIVLFAVSEMVDDENKVWYVMNNVPDIESEDNYKKTIDMFSHIGNLLETSSKHIVQELYALIRLANDKQVEYEKIKNQDFGVVIQNILDTNVMNNVMTVELPDGRLTRISDWRNISFHKTYSYKNEKVICEYGKKIRNHFELDMSDFLRYIHQIVRKCNVLVIARIIFMFDYGFQNTSSFTIDNDMIDPIYIYQLKIQLLSQQFELREYTECKNNIEVNIEDLCVNKDEKERIIHCSQLLLNVWNVWKKDTVIINYLKNGISQYKLCVDGNVCKKINDNIEPINYLAEKFIITKLI